MSLPLLSPKQKHWITPLIVYRFSSTISSPSLLHPIKGIVSLIIHHRINSLPSFGFLLRKKSLSPELKSPPPDRIRCSTIASYDRWGPRRAPLPPQAFTVISHASQPSHVWTPASSYRRRSTVNQTPITIYNSAPGPRHFSYENKSKSQ
jgi:hypothetical protein